MFPIALTEQMSIYMLNGIIEHMLTGNIVAYAALTPPAGDVSILKYEDVASLLDSRYKSTASPTWVPPFMYTYGTLRYAVTQSINWFMKNNTSSAVLVQGAYIVDESRSKLIAVQTSWPYGVLFANSEQQIFMTLQMRASS